MDAATLAHCQAWIDYRCSSLKDDIGQIDSEGAAQVVTVDKALAVYAHNVLVNLRIQMTAENTPEGYPGAVQAIYINDADMQRLRNREDQGAALLVRCLQTGGIRTDSTRDLWNDIHTFLNLDPAS